MTPGPRTADEPDEVARLLSAPLSVFVEERKRLAAALKSVGRREEAQRIAKLAKPSVAVWVVNQLARSDGPLLQRLGEVSAAMRTAPRRPREGARADDGAGSDYAGLLAQHRDTLRALRTAAERILAASQLGASPAVLERITHTLRAGMADDETRATIRQGRLLRDVGDVDFANLIGAGADAGGAPHDEPHHARPARVPAAPPPPTRAAAAPAASSDQAEARAHAAREREQAAEMAAQERTRAREAAARERERERAHASAKREVERLRAKADTARERVTAEERTVAAARRALTDGEKRLAAAQAEADETARALATAEETAQALVSKAASAHE